MSSSSATKEISIYDKVDELLKTVEGIYSRLNDLDENMSINTRAVERLKRLVKLQEERLEDLERASEKGSTKKEEPMEEITLKSVPFERAEAMIYDYVKKHTGCSTSEIFIDLELEPSLVSQVLKKLKDDSKLRGVPLLER